MRIVIHSFLAIEFRNSLEHSENIWNEAATAIWITNKCIAKESNELKRIAITLNDGTVIAIDQAALIIPSINSELHPTNLKVLLNNESLTNVVAVIQRDPEELTGSKKLVIIFWPKFIVEYAKWK